MFCFGRFLAKTAELSSGICEGLDAPSFPCKYHKFNVAFVNTGFWSKLPHALGKINLLA